MIDSRTAPYAALVLRLTTGVALLAHSVYLKPFVFTMEGTEKFFASLGLPPAMAWLVMFVEAITGIMLVLGVRTRYAALAAMPVLVGAAWAHWGSGWMFASKGGGWEYPAFWAMTLLAQALLGDGAHALAPTPAADGRRRASTALGTA